MSPIETFFARLAAIEDPVLTDLSVAGRREVSGVELAHSLDRLAGRLRDLGINSGDRVVTLFDNTIDSALTLLTAMRHGLTLCLQPPTATGEDLASVAALCAATRQVDATGRAASGLPAIRVDDLDRTDELAPPNVAPGTPLTITFTSGSTGKPKGIVHAAESFLNCAAEFNEASRISGADRFLNVMPMYYMAGVFNGVLAPLQAGASVVIGDAFTTDTALRFWQLVQDHHISALWLSPTMLSMVARLDRAKRAAPTTLRRIYVGTGPLEARDSEAFAATYGLPPLQSYGLSELLYVSVENADRPRPGTVGEVLRGVAADLLDDGTVSVDSPFAFLGYMENGRVQPPAGPFVTSDLGAFTPDGMLELVGRSDDIILRGGVNINPIQLEEMLRPTIGTEQYCVTGLPDETLGQRVVLVLEGAPTANDGALLAAARRTVSPQMRTMRLDALARVPTLPRGPTGKIRRSELRNLLGSVA